jgi:predicted P-loop ATPase
VLGGKWFSDTDLGDLKSKDASLSLRGIWILELPEGAIFSKASARDLKAFTSKCTDDLVPKYSNTMVSVPRGCVFALTINDTSDYLTDNTGNRRFWPVLVGNVRLDALREDRDQLWAEAVALFKSGAKWWPATETEKKLCSEEQTKREDVDPWHERILQAIRFLPTVTISFVLSSVGVTTDKQGRREALRAAACLCAIG